MFHLRDVDLTSFSLSIVQWTVGQNTAMQFRLKPISHSPTEMPPDSGGFAFSNSSSQFKACLCPRCMYFSASLTQGFQLPSPTLTSSFLIWHVLCLPVYLHVSTTHPSPTCKFELPIFLNYISFFPCSFFQMPLLTEGIRIHGEKLTEQLKPLHNRLSSCFQELKEKVEKLYGVITLVGAVLIACKLFLVSATFYDIDQMPNESK